MYCGTASCLSGRHGGKCLSVSIINKQLHQIVVIMCPSRLKNGREKTYFVNQRTAGVQTSGKRDPRAGLVPGLSIPELSASHCVPRAFVPSPGDFSMFAGCGFSNCSPGSWLGQLLLSAPR